ncbi:MAG: ATP-dependent helicase [Flavobacteriales bacterium]|nr:ATP-dependent helicase [Flavobacteriales bacterium]
MSTTDPALNSEFRETLARLNPAQLQAVQHIQGPVMTVAGPGTGKTQILAARIGQILMETDTRPNEILCLTYTDAATIAMRKRLLKFIGPDAFKVAIHTFHSFCNRVIQENPLEFPKNELEPLGDLEQIEILDLLVKSLPNDHVLINLKSDDSYLRGALQDLFAFMKKEDISADEISRRCTLRKEELETSEEFRYKRKSGVHQAGDLNMNKIQPILNKLEKLEAAARLFPKYMELMLAHGYYDFDDMILWVLDLFKRNNDLLLNYQEQYLYVLVDEFQDTSGSQNHLLDLLCNYWESPNVFAVGDDDQSIFRFQGAEVQNILDFDAKYAAQGLERVMLTENYRSTQTILDAATALIEQNEDRLVRKIPELTKHLRSQNNNSIGQKIEILQCFNSTHEAAFIGQRIIELIEQGEDPNEIAVIYRKHVQVDELAEYLKTKSVRLQMRKRTDVLENSVVQLILKVLEWVARETTKPFSADHLLFHILHEPVFGLLPVEVGIFSNHIFRQKNFKPWRVILEEMKEEPVPFTNPTLQNRLLAAHDKLENWLAKAKSLSLQSLIEFLQHDLGVLERIAKERSYQDLESYSTFFDFVKSACQRNRNLDAQGLLDRIELLKAHKIGIPQEVLLYNGDGVNLITAHSSKGLEFNHVFLIGCTENNWNGGGKNSRRFATNEIIPNTASDGDIQENRRLFYVALTRARKQVYMSIPQFDLNGKELSPSSFVGEMTSKRPDLFFETIVNLPDSAILDWTIATSRSEPGSYGSPLTFIKDTLENYILSVTHLNSFLRCPTAFYFGSILRVPAAKNKYMSFGTAIHRALDASINAGIQNMNPDQLVEHFTVAMEREKAGFNEVEFNRFMDYGRKILPEFYKNRIDLWRSMPEVRTEVMIDHVTINGVPIKGQIDLMVINDHDIDVVDYKTGKPENGIKKLKRPLEDAEPDSAFEDRFGGDYWRQLVFYAILVNNSPSFKKPFGTGTMDFIEPKADEKYVRSTERISTEEIRIVEDQILSSYERIRNMDFADGCNEPDCEWCNFNKKYPHWLDANKS